MRYSSDYKQQTREKILAAASRLFREKGYNGVGVDAIMAAAGLTAGGFYAHFASKEALFTEVITTILATRNEALREMFQSNDESAWLEALIKSYLSRSHRDSVAEGCPLPALTSDVTRSQSAKENFQHYLEISINEIAAKLPEQQTPARSRAIAMMVQLVGGLMLARAVNDEQLSNEILQASRAMARQLCRNTTESTTQPPTQSPAKDDKPQ